MTKSTQPVIGDDTFRPTSTWGTGLPCRETLYLKNTAEVSQDHTTLVRVQSPISGSLLTSGARRNGWHGMKDPVSGSLLQYQGARCQLTTPVQKQQMQHSKQFYLTKDVDITLQTLRNTTKVSSYTNEKVGTAGTPTGMNASLRVYRDLQRQQQRQPQHATSWKSSGACSARSRHVEQQLVAELQTDDVHVPPEDLQVHHVALDTPAVHAPKQHYHKPTPEIAAPSQPAHEPSFAALETQQEPEVPAPAEPDMRQYAAPSAGSRGNSARASAAALPDEVVEADAVQPEAAADLPEQAGADVLQESAALPQQDEVLPEAEAAAGGASDVAQGKDDHGLGVVHEEEEELVGDDDSGVQAQETPEAQAEQDDSNNDNEEQITEAVGDSALPEPEVLSELGTTGEQDTPATEEQGAASLAAEADEVVAEGAADASGIIDAADGGEALPVATPVADVPADAADGNDEPEVMSDGEPAAGQETTAKDMDADADADELAVDASPAEPGDGAAALEAQQ